MLTYKVLVIYNNEAKMQVANIIIQVGKRTLLHGTKSAGRVLAVFLFWELNIFPKEKNKCLSQ